MRNPSTCNNQVLGMGMAPARWPKLPAICKSAVMMDTCSNGNEAHVGQRQDASHAIVSGCIRTLQKFKAGAHFPAPTTLLDAKATGKAITNSSLVVRRVVPVNFDHHPVLAKPWGLLWWPLATPAALFFRRTHKSYRSENAIRDSPPTVKHTWKSF